MEDTELRLLLAEDEALDAELSLREIARAGMRVDWRRVQTEADFRTALREFPPDVILSDFSMPVFDGLRALEIAREVAPQVPFIFVSGTVGEEFAIQALKQGATDYVLKSNLVRLPASVQRAVRDARAHAGILELERERRAMDAGLRQAQNMAGLSHVVTLEDGSFGSWSETMPRLIGVPAAAMPKSTRDWLSLIHPEDRAGFRATAIEAARRSDRMEVEYRIRRSDGAWVYVKQVMEPLHRGGQTGAAVQWFNTLQDVTSERQAAHALQLSEERYRATFEQAAVAIVHSSLEGDILSVNRAFCALTGYSRAEAILLSIRDVAEAGDLAQSTDGRAQLVEGRVAHYEREMRTIRKDGTRRWVHVTTSLLRDPAGTPTQFVSVLHDITERKQAERALAESEARFRSLTRLSSDWYWEQDEEYRFRAFSGGEGAAKWGPDQSEQVGRRRWELPGIVPLSSSWEEHRAVLDARQPFRDFEYARVIGNESRYVSASGEPVYDAEGRFAGYRGTARDISDRRRREEELRRFRLALDNSADIILIIDPASLRYVDANETACRLLGYSRSELIGMGAETLLPVRRATLEQAYQDLISDPDAPSGMTSYYRCKDGSRLPFESTRRLLRVGDSWLIVAVARDIRPRIAAEQARRQAEDRFRSIFENSAEGIFMISPGGAMQTCNMSSARMLGYDSPEELTASITDLSTQLYVDHADRQRLLDALRSQGVVRGFETRFYRKDASIMWASVSVRTMKDESGRASHVLGSMQDITERHAQQERIERLTRVYAVLSGINAAIVRVRDRDTLFREACRIAVDAGKLKAAWIGLVEPAAGRVVPAAWRGIDDDYIGKLPLGLDPAAPDYSVAGQMLRDRAPVTVAHLASDRRIRLGAEAARRGLESLAMLPLYLAGEITGVLALYAGEPEFFDEEELKLLQELAGDISFAMEHIAKSARADYLAYYDEMTGLANRALFRERLSNFLHSAAHGSRKLALALLDVERMRSVNESLGRHAGDQLLRQLKERLLLVADAAALGRMGADQFAVVLQDVKGRGNAVRHVERLRRAVFDPPFQIEGRELRVSARAGIAVSPGGGADAETLLGNAEVALRRAKKNSERYVAYERSLARDGAETLTLETQLRRALERDEFVLHYQPKVDVGTRRISGAEALIRWQSPELGLVPPGRFVRLMEETGLILEAGAWAMRTAVADHGRWADAGLRVPRIAVNVSAVQLRKSDFVETVRRAVSAGANPPGIDLEITESLVMDDIEGNIRKLKEVRELGLQIAVDDFGTGYSSLGYLAKLPVQMLKIDRSFVITMLNDADTMSLVSTIISLAHALRLKVVAEGVDSEDQAKTLRLLRCDELQGYLFSKPLPAAEFERLLAEDAAKGS